MSWLPLVNRNGTGNAARRMRSIASPACLAASALDPHSPSTKSPIWTTNGTGSRDSLARSRARARSLGVTSRVMRQ